eukprot:gene5166-biopygen4344
MTRFQVYRSRHDDLLLLDLQADFLDVLKTRIVAPLLPVTEMPWTLGQLNPRFEIAGRVYVMATQRMAAIGVAEIGEPKSAPLFACIGLLCAWQFASVALATESFPTAWESIRAVPSILGDKESLVNIGASLRRMVIGFGLAVLFAIPLGLMMGRLKSVAKPRPASPARAASMVAFSAS